jgi:uncharacterized protein YecE (DUF72 family)
MGKLFIGTSGWSYPHWRKRFYPADITQKTHLEYYAANFNTVELNNSFYRLPSAGTFDDWRRRTPDGFVFSVKASRYITHVRKLKNAGDAWERFYTNARSLGDKLGPVLFQFPANWGVAENRLASFLELLPRKIRAVFEFRHSSWFEPDIYDLLRRHNAALCQARSANWPSTDTVTASFVFIRMHGSRPTYGSRYSTEELRDEAARIRGYLGNGSDVYVYFNNDAQAFAVDNARELRELLS